MKEHELIEQLSATLTKTKVHQLAALADDTRVTVVSLHHICYYPENESIAFRAAWVLEDIALKYPERFLPVFHEFVHQLANQKNSSCQRHFTKILMQITHPRAPEVFLHARTEIDGEQLVETVFEWLIDPLTPVAVQANCIEILFNMSGEFCWISDELANQIEFLMRSGSSAMQSRGKKILHKLRKSKPQVDSDR